jgi:fructose-1,6-bisphosphatase/inositol monophosphatase family enzyme
MLIEENKLTHWIENFYGYGIIEEAGGVFTDLAGRRTAFGGSAVATNAALAVEVRRLVCAP